MSEPGKTKPRGMLWIYVLVTAAVLVWAVGGRLLHTPQGDGDAPVGGPFRLVDHTGLPRGDADFRGRYMLIYFGYTHCPDVCPISLQTASDALDLLPPEVAEHIVPILISVDPERDTPERLADYVELFHPRLVGLTGTPDQIRAVAESFRVFAQKSGEGADYTVDHTSLLFLMGPDGAFVERFPGSAAAERVADQLRAIVRPDVTG